MRFWVICPKKRSTWLIHEPDVGVKCMWNLRCFASHSRTAGVLVGSVVVDDQMQIEILGRVAIDGAQEAQPFLVAVTLHALTDHPASRDLEGGEQRGGAVTLVVVSHSSGTPVLERQTRLRAVECLDLAVLIDRE